MLHPFSIEKSLCTRCGQQDEKGNGMKLKTGITAIDLLKAVGECRGEVIIATEEGDRINLKSKLSQYVFAVIAVDDEIMSKASLILSDSKDLAKLSAFVEDDRKGE